jgi:hypothetical protein
MRDRFNATEHLLDRHVEAGGGARVALRVDGRSLTFGELLRRVEAGKSARARRAP